MKAFVSSRTGGGGSPTKIAEGEGMVGGCGGWNGGRQSVRV